MTKSLLVAAAFNVLFFVSTVSTNGVNPENMLDPKHVTDLMKIINDGRRDFAKRFNVANMNELEHDESLTVYGHYLSKNCPKPNELYAHKKYQVIPVLLGPSAFSGNITNELFRLTQQHLTNPIQTNIGAWYLGQQCNDYNLIAVMGPSAKEVVKSGAPGSTCGADKKNVDGLCVKKNEARRNIARL